MLDDNTSIIEHSVLVIILFSFYILTDTQNVLPQLPTVGVFIIVFSAGLIIFEFDLYYRYPKNSSGDLSEIKEKFTQEWIVADIEKDTVFYNCFKDEIIIPEKLAIDYHIGDTSKEEIIENLIDEGCKSNMRDLMIVRSVVSAILVSVMISILFVSQDIVYTGVVVLMIIGLYYFNKHVTQYVESSAEEYANNNLVS